MAAGDVRHAEDLVEAQRDPSAVHVPGRPLVRGVEDAAAEQPAVAVLIVGRRRERAHDADERAPREVVVVRLLLAATHARRAGAQRPPAVQLGRDPLDLLGSARELLGRRVLGSERRVDEVSDGLGESNASFRDEGVAGRGCFRLHHLPL